MNEREKAVVLVIHAPEMEAVFPEMKEIFGNERAVHINRDLYVRAYSTANSYPGTIKVIGYSKTTKTQDLTWLSSDDPGFLECRGRDYSEMLLMTFALAFNTGAEKAVFINHLCPYVKKEHIDFAFSKIGEKSVVVGPAQDGRVYLLGLDKENYRALESFSLWKDNMLEEVMEKAKKQKLSAFMLEELAVIKDEDMLRKWMENRDNDVSVFRDRFDFGPEQRRSVADKAVPEKEKAPEHDNPKENEKGKRNRHKSPFDEAGGGNRQ
ncbi:MAG: hypothetical protein COT17_02515 [Elusimicrobia bacterium CG08_land_8_20_14_0_20_51_18]|nr:MAG: hypothetical protein COT17_02515 [Elusimicrobia bacterium CG08_land_8_20_14_0_20_51_18]